MTGQLELWPGWEVEPCDTAEPAPPTRTGHGNPCANVPDEPQDYQTTDTVIIKGELL